VEFTQCIDQIVIVYGTGSNSPTHNPSYSSITIGERIGFTAEFCPDPCENEDGSQPREEYGTITNYRFGTNGLSSGVYLVQVRTQEWRSKAQQMVILNR